MGNQCTQGPCCNNEENIADQVTIDANKANFKSQHPSTETGLFDVSQVLAKPENNKQRLMYEKNATKIISLIKGHVARIKF